MTGLAVDFWGNLTMARLRTTAPVLTCVAAAAALTGCSGGIGPSKSGERTYSVSGDVRSVTAKTSGGSIEVVATNGSGPVRVTEKYSYHGDRPAPTHSVADGGLTLDAAVCRGLGDNCTVSYRVQVPRATAVDLHTSGGDVTVRGTAGSVAAETSGGDVTLDDVAAHKARAKTSGGSVSATFTTVPDDVVGTTSGGDVTIRLPKSTYDVEATTSGGDRKVTVPTDPDARRRVEARTSGGDVSVLATS
ncbi:DUF4097 family beta strand repeat-containing protein [Streptomyces catenulae]|uniref:DUF4097 family beta strand repeat-containing protein n=1 Tax=Streptomyces catenulae TaxID=66875 RepID=A0ABV2YXR9_9ACTN|nr:DUF4097 family beta strand repeat-containing protein [Streptomyces catenulae]